MNTTKNLFYNKKHKELTMICSFKNHNINHIKIILLTAAPVNPIKGTFPSSLYLVKVIASPTYFKSFSTFG